MRITLQDIIEEFEIDFNNKILDQSFSSEHIMKKILFP